MSAFDTYFICTSPRSGSTLLCRLLSQCGIAGHPASYFHEPSLEEWRSDLGLPQASSLAEVIVAAQDEGRGDARIAGVRLQHFSLAYFTDQLRVLQPRETTDRERIEGIFGATAFIYLRRADKLAQAISFVKARQTGLWHMAPDGSEIERLAPPSEPAYDHDAISRQMAEFRDQDLAWAAWFQAQRISPLRLTYDALSADPGRTLAQVLAFLSLPAAAAEGIAADTARLSDRVNELWAARFKAESGIQGVEHNNARR